MSINSIRAGTFEMRIAQHKAGEHGQADKHDCPMCLCEVDSFIFHASTGGDLPCSCGFHDPKAKTSAAESSSVDA